MFKLYFILILKQYKIILRIENEDLFLEPFFYRG